MRKTFCNCCEEEIVKENFYSLNGLVVEIQDHKFKVVPPDAMDIHFDVCKYCVIDAVTKLDDRPKDQK